MCRGNETDKNVNTNININDSKLLGQWLLWQSVFVGQKWHIFKSTLLAFVVLELNTLQRRIKHFSEENLKEIPFQTSMFSSENQHPSNTQGITLWQSLSKGLVITYVFVCEQGYITKFV